MFSKTEKNAPTDKMCSHGQTDKQMDRYAYHFLVIILEFFPLHTTTGSLNTSFKVVETLGSSKMYLVSKPDDNWKRYECLQKQKKCSHGRTDRQTNRR